MRHARRRAATLRQMRDTARSRGSASWLGRERCHFDDCWRLQVLGVCRDGGMPNTESVVYKTGFHCRQSPRAPTRRRPLRKRRGQRLVGMREIGPASRLAVDQRTVVTHIGEDTRPLLLVAVQPARLRAAKVDAADVETCVRRTQTSVISSAAGRGHDSGRPRSCTVRAAVFVSN